MLFERLPDLFQLLGRLGHDLDEFSHRFGRAHAGDHVLALGVDEEFTVKHLLAGSGIARKSHAGTGFVAGVAEDHGLHVDGGSPFAGDVVFAAIDNGAIIHPGTKDSADGPFELFPRIGREFLAGPLLDEGLESFDQLLKSGGVDLRVFHMLIFREQFLLEAFDDGFKGFMVLVGRLLHPHDDVAIHLDKPAVTVPGETGVATGLLQRHHGLIIQAQVQDRVHHARHRIARSRTHGDQKGLLHVPETLAEDLLRVRHAGLDLRPHFLGIGFVVGVIISADFGGDGEAGGNGQADAGHFGQVGAFAPQEGFHAAVAVGCFVAK